MTTLCNMFCPDDLKQEISSLYTSQNQVSHIKNQTGAEYGESGEINKGVDDKERSRNGEREEVRGEEVRTPEPIRIEVDVV